MLKINTQEADTIFYGGKVHSVNAKDEIFEAIAIKDNRVLALGTDSEIKALAAANTKMIDLKGKSLIPGINDGHNHIWEAGIMYDGVVVFGIDSISKLIDVLKTKAESLEDGKWIQGGSYIESQFEENRTPTRYDLDKASTKHPIVIERIFGACVTNSLALELAGITKDTPNPEKGEVVKNPETGEPTGELKGNAVLLVRSAMPGAFGSDEFGAGTGEPSVELMEKSISLALEKYREYGITSVTEPGVSATVCKAYHKILDEGKLTCRIDLMPNWYGFTLKQDDEQLSKLIDNYNFASGYGNDWIRYTALKMAIDGGLTSGTALKSWPYKGESSPREVKLRLDIDKLDAYIKTAHDAGWNIGIHVMGDIAIEKAVDAMYKAIKANPRPHRHYIIHAYYPNEEALRKMGEVGIMASVQGSFIYGEADGYDDLLPRDKQESFLPLKSYQKAGVICSMSTDMPCADVNPFWGMYSAVTRKGMRGYCLGTDECITINEAIRMMTVNGAILNGEQDEKGTLEPGKLADLVVLSADLTTIDPENLKHLQAELTMLDGKIIFERNE